MAFVSKMVVRESRNGDGGLFSYGGELEVTVNADELPFALEAKAPDGRVAESFAALGITLRLALDGGPMELKKPSVPVPGEVKPLAPAEAKPVVPAEAPRPVQPAVPQAASGPRPLETKGPAGEVTLIGCKVCGTSCEKRVGRTQNTYLYCPKCQANRKITGEPFPPRANP